MAGSNAFMTLFMKGLVYLLLLNTITPVFAAPVEGEVARVVREQRLKKRDWPVQEGQPDSCNAWTVVRRTDTCDSIVQLAKVYDIIITKTLFLQYNPALNNDCASIKTSVWVCIQTEKGAQPPISTKKTTTTTKRTTTTTTTKKTTTTTKRTTTTTKRTTTTTKRTTTTTTTTKPTTTATTSKATTTSKTTTTTKDDEETSTTSPPETSSSSTTSDGPGVKTTTTTSKSSTTSEDPEESTSSTTSRSSTTSEEPEESTSSTTSKTTTTSSSTTTTTSAKPSQTGYKYAVVGAQNGCANRQDINTLEEKDPDVFNLLLVALDKLQKAGEDDPWSYFQLSGIHGNPFVAWPDPAVTSPGDGGTFDKSRGYCPHGSLLFATWHRPYMLIIEQALVAAAEDIAQQYKTEALKTKYQAAAKRLRFPYWDWATRKYESHTPDIVKKEKVTVITPDGSKLINNPLHSYIFKDKENRTFGIQFVGAERTTRGTAKFTGATDEGAADAAMQAGFITRRQQTFNNLMSTSSFNDFSSSLEVLHNQVHVEIGGEGGGQMYFLAYSAFDPIFWLHHNNIDRLMAIWQAANPGLKLTKGRAVGTFQRRVQSGVTQDDENTPLYPFKHPNGDWWTSKDVEDVRAIWDYGYGFPEVPCEQKDLDKEALDAFSTEQINLLYKPENLAQKKRAEVESRSEWNVNIVVDQAERSETFSIYVFLGKPPSNPSDWIKADNKVGMLSVLGNPNMNRVSNIQTAIIPINALLKAKGIEGTEDEINEYLKENLIWTAMSDNKEIDVTQFKTLKVGVTVNTVTVSTDVTVKAKFSDPVLVTKITKDKKAGVVKVEDLAKPADKSGAKTLAAQRFAAIVVGETSDAADNAAKIEYPSKSKTKSLKTSSTTVNTSSAGAKTTTTTTTTKATPTPTPTDDDGDAGYGYGGDDEEDDYGYGGYKHKRSYGGLKNKRSLGYWF